MITRLRAAPIRRRTLLKSALALGAARLGGPFILSARGETPVGIGLVTPLTGPYAALGRNEQLGAEYAVDQLNAAGGILGRPVALRVEDSTSGEVSVAVRQTAKLIGHDKVSFMLGTVNSALSLAMSQQTNELRTLHIVTGGHIDALTGAECHWNVFRTCSTTQMEANAVAAVLIKKYGRKWYYITPDYSFGHALQAGLEQAVSRLGGITLGADLTPLGTADFSAALGRAEAARPDVLILLTAGDDSVKALKQAVQRGLHRKLHIAGALQELEVLDGLPPDARIGSWVFEWYWNQPDSAPVAAFVDGIAKQTGKMPTARTWFGFVAAMSCGLIANQERTLDPVQLARALAGFKLPPEVALSPGEVFYRAEDHQLIAPLFVGEAQARGSTPEDLFKVATMVEGIEVATAPARTGCRLVWPA